MNPTEGYDLRCKWILAYDMKRRRERKRNSVRKKRQWRRVGKREGTPGGDASSSGTRGKCRGMWQHLCHGERSVSSKSSGR